MAAIKKARLIEEHDDDPEEESRNRLLGLTKEDTADDTTSSNIKDLKTTDNNNKENNNSKDDSNQNHEVKREKRRKRKINKKLDANLQQEDSSESEVEIEMPTKTKLTHGDIMSKILSRKVAKNVILARTSGDATVKKVVEYEVVGEKKVVPVIVEKQLKEKPKQTKKIRDHEWDVKFLVKPDPVIDYVQERKLCKIATKGVVQLFSAIEKYKAAQAPPKKREKVLRNVDKKSFMDVLLNNASIKEEDVKPEVKEDNTSESDSESDNNDIELIDSDATKIPKAAKSGKRNWDALDDDYYKAPKL